MTRADFKTLAWLAPLAGVLAFWWLFWSDPCLDNEIRNHLRAMSPPVADASLVAPMGPDAVVVDNPYGHETCHYWPDAVDDSISFGALGAIALLIGFLGARNFQQRARIRAAAIMFVTLSLALVLSLLVYLSDNLQYFEQLGFELLLMMISLWLAIALGAAIVTWIAAVLTLRWRPRD